MYRTYMKSMHSLWDTRYWATWQPSVRWKLGDVGTIERGQLIRIDDLANFGVRFTAQVGDSKDRLTYSSQGSVQLTFKLAGQAAQGFQALGKADAGVLVEFSENEALVVSLRGVAESHIASVRDLAAEIVKLYIADQWKQEYAAVTHLVSARSGTILASSNNGSAVELRAAAAVGRGPVEIGDLSAGMSMARSQNLGLEVVGTNLTPLFRVVRLKDSWLTDPRVVFARQRVRGARPEPPPTELLEQAKDEWDTVLEAPEPPSDGDDL